MRIIGIDPGYERMGVAVLEKPARGKEELLYSACLRTKAGTPFPVRLGELGLLVSTLYDMWKPDVCALEKLFFATNQKTAMGVAEIRGMLMYIATSRGVVLEEYTPLQVKVAIAGYGKATKHQVSAMVEYLVTLKHKPKHDDEYDAIAIALTCAASRRT